MARKLPQAGSQTSSLPPELQPESLEIRVDHRPRSSSIAVLPPGDPRLSLLRCPITGLPNQFLLHDRLSQSLFHARRYGESIAVLAIDVEGLRGLDDAATARADELLRAVAERLDADVRECDTLAHLGQDRFAIVIGGLESSDSANRVARKFARRLAEPHALGEQRIALSANIGIALFPGDGDGATELLSIALRKAMRPRRFPHS